MPKTPRETKTKKRKNPAQEMGSPTGKTKKKGPDPKAQPLNHPTTVSVTARGPGHRTLLVAIDTTLGSMLQEDVHLGLDIGLKIGRAHV